MVFVFIAASGIGICSCHTITARADKYLLHFETGSSGDLFFERLGNSNFDLRKPMSDSTVWRVIILIRQRQRNGLRIIDLVENPGAGECPVVFHRGHRNAQRRPGLLSTPPSLPMKRRLEVRASREIGSSSIGNLLPD